MSWSDLRDSVNATALDAFGESITFQTAAGVGDPIEITAVWTDAEPMPQGVRATAWILESNLGGLAPKKNDIVRRGNFSYRVVDPPDGVAAQRDGTGGVMLYLRQFSHAPDA